MDYIPLGPTSQQIPRVGFGTWQFRAVGVLPRAVELGAGFVDTAESYGTEPAVADDIEGIRDRVFIATKVSPQNFKYRDVLEHSAASLSRLRTNRIDLYQLHWPNPDIPIAETMRAVETLVAEGKVRFIGVSNFSVDQMKAAQDALKSNALVSNQVKYNLFARDIERDILPYCQQNRIAVIAYSPLARGDFGGGDSALRRVAAEVGKTPAQVMLNWCISHPNVMVIPKTNRLERVDEAAGAVGWKLTPEQIAALERS